MGLILHVLVSLLNSSLMKRLSLNLLLSMQILEKDFSIHRITAKYIVLIRNVFSQGEKKNLKKFQ